MPMNRLVKPHLWRLSKSLFKLATISCVTSQSACVGLTLEGARIAGNERIRAKYLSAADQGDAEAQYQVGNSYCCTPGDSDKGYYDNQIATEYLCLAARQGHGPAALKLGKIHSGDRIDGVRILRRVVTAAVNSDQENVQIAAYWLTQAKLNGQKEADNLLQDLPLQDLSQYTSIDHTPCTMQQVYGD